MKLLLNIITLLLFVTATVLFEQAAYFEKPREAYMFVEVT